MLLVRHNFSVAYKARGFLPAGVRPSTRHFSAPSGRSVRCQGNKENSDSDSRGQGFGKLAGRSTKKQKANFSNTAEALIQSLGEVSSSSGRDAGSHPINIVLGPSDSEAKWRQLDEKVNQYPGRRDFKAIGSGGDDFKQTIVQAVEGVVGPVKADMILQRPSSQGKFISVTLQDVKVQNPDQVLAVYAAMRKDKRLRYYL